MPGQPDFDRVIDMLAGPPPADLQQVFAAMKRLYGLDHVLHCDAERHPGGLWHGTLLHDPNPSLQRLVREQGITALAPALAAFARLYGPAEVDLASLAPTAPDWARMLRDCGLDHPALVFPLVPSRPGTAFLICTSLDKDRWNHPVRLLQRDLSLTAGLLHAGLVATRDAAIAPATPHSDGIRLTPREREVLQWVAAGKSYWEIARILGISERTIRHFMANCRIKLDSVSNKQAVAKAVAAAMIEAPPSPLLKREIEYMYNQK